MKYIALLRGINVGGNSIIKMTDLKAAVEKCGFSGVKTYIQSGNIIFESGEKPGRVAAKLEDCLLKTFKFQSGVVVLTFDQFKKIVSQAPADWDRRTDLRRYIAFIRPPTTAQDVLKEARPRKDVDFIQAGKGVVYMSTLLSGLTKTGFTKLITTKVYKDITMRNYTTVQKLLELAE